MHIRDVTVIDLRVYRYTFYCAARWEMQKCWNKFRSQSNFKDQQDQLKTAVKMLNAFERKVLRKIYGPVLVNGQW